MYKNQLSSSYELYIIYSYVKLPKENLKRQFKTVYIHLSF